MGKPRYWKPKGKNTIDFGGTAFVPGVGKGGSKPRSKFKGRIGNRSPLRAAKLLGWLDATAPDGGIHRSPRSAIAEAELHRGTRKLQEIAYNAGFGSGQAHLRYRAGLFLAAGRGKISAKSRGPGGTKPYRPGSEHARRRALARDLWGLRKGGDIAALTAYKANRGIGRNVGSFKHRKGNWRKGTGGRFIGSGG